RRGLWGGPPGGGRAQPTAAPRLGLEKAGDVQLAAMVAGAAPPETFLAAAGPSPAVVTSLPAELDAGNAPVREDAGAPSGPPPEAPRGGCAGCATGTEGGGALGAALGALVMGWVMRRRVGRV